MLAERAMENWAPPPKLSVTEWADTYRVLPQQMNLEPDLARILVGLLTRFLSFSKTICLNKFVQSILRSQCVDNLEQY